MGGKESSGNKEVCAQYGQFVVPSTIRILAFLKGSFENHLQGP
jgi:hypothetical protein